MYSFWGAIRGRESILMGCFLCGVGGGFGGAVVVLWWFVSWFALCCVVYGERVAETRWDSDITRVELIHVVHDKYLNL